MKDMFFPPGAVAQTEIAFGSTLVASASSFATSSKRTAVPRAPSATA